MPGAYRALQEQDCVECTRPDPRLYPVLSDTPKQVAEWERLKAEGRRKAAQLLDEVLAAGGPIVVPRWRIGDNHVPVPKDVPMFADRTVAAFVVWPDDRVAPAS